MSITYSWKFGPPKTATEGNLSKVVKVVPWTLSASDGVRTEEASNRLQLGPADPANFIPFANLTQAQIVIWVESGLGAKPLAALKADLAGRYTTALPTAPPAMTETAWPF